MFQNIFCFICLLFLGCTGLKSGQERNFISCQNNVHKVFNVYKKEYEFGIKDFLKRVCPKMSDLEECVIKTTKWWPFLSQIIYSDNAPKYVCQDLDPNCTVK